jgi:Flp pilus assembly protein TadB
MISYVSCRVFRILCFSLRYVANTIQYDTIRYDIYLLQLGFHQLALGLILVSKRQRTVRCIRRNSTDHRTHKMKSKTCKTIKQRYRGADNSLARPGRKQATAAEDFDVHISYL